MGSNHRKREIKMNQEEIADAIWETSNSIDVLNSKLCSVCDLLEILAERVSSEPESGALWLARDTIKTLSDAYEERTHDLMAAMREVRQLKPTPKKGKK
jgi:hypothetical protein